jgi:hypothetical protein
MSTVHKLLSICVLPIQNVVKLNFLLPRFAREASDLGKILSILILRSLRATLGGDGAGRSTAETMLTTSNPYFRMKEFFVPRRKQTSALKADSTLLDKESFESGR